MPNKTPDRCPVCGEELTITKLACYHCHTKIEGDFALSRFCRLPADHLEFVEVFLKCRGSIKDVERELGVSYPTVRNRLDTVLQALGYSSGKSDLPAEDERRQDILDSLERGELSAEEASRLLRKTKR